MPPTWFVLLLASLAEAVTLSSSLSSAFTNTTATAAIGDYVAAGLHLDKHSSSQHLAMSTSDSNSTITRGTAAVTGTAVFDNTTIDDGQCWAQWSSYWYSSTKVWSSYTTFQTIYDYTAYSQISIQPTLSTERVTTTETAGNGNFATKTYVTTITDVQTIKISISTTNFMTTKAASARYTPSVTAPPCILPSYMPQCQSAWVSWGSHGAVAGAEPQCSQAKVTGSLCSTVISSWLHQQQVDMVGQNLGEIEGKVGMQELPHMANGTQVYPNSTTSWYWPSTSKVAPGCTVGCQSCRVSGSNVKLLYWPPATVSGRNSSFITSSPDTNAIVTAVAHGTTLTSPTVYISFDRLHGSDSCSVIGKTLSNVIVPISNTATLNSLWGWDRYWGLQSTASFNFTDLYVTPVPDSLYMSQPRCASSSTSIWYSCLRYGGGGPQICQDARSSKNLCATTLPYEPVISIPHEVQQLQPEWAGCIGGLLGVYELVQIP